MVQFQTSDTEYRTHQLCVVSVACRASAWWWQSPTYWQAFNSRQGQVCRQKGKLSFFSILMKKLLTEWMHE